MAKCWGGWVGPDWDAEGKLPAITLSFMPISHVMGRVILYSTLGAGGTAYFAAQSDLSTLLDDLALVRPTKLDLVPRIWEMLFQEVQSEVDRRATDGADRDTVETQVMAEQRKKLLGGRQFSAMTGSAPISAELRAWVEEFLDIHLIEVYGSTEDGVVLVDGQIRRPPVIDYKLVDVPDLGYFATDRPHPRGELLVKSTDLIPGYYKRPEVTAELFDAEGWYHTGDVMAEIAPGSAGLRGPPQQRAQALAGRVRHRLQAGGGLRRHPSVRQIFVYGNSARSYLLAVIVPTDDALASVGGDVAAVKPLLSDALQSIARDAGLQSYEIPRDFLVETTPFTLENGLLTGIRKLARPQLKEHYGPELEQLYVDLADGQADVLRALRQDGADRPVLETVSRAASALLGAAAADVAPDARVHRPRRRFVVGVDLRQPAARHLRRRRAGRGDRQPGQRPGGHRRLHRGQRAGGSKRPTYAAVHGRDATEVHASELTLDKFLDAATLGRRTVAAGPEPRGAHRAAHRRDRVPRPLPGAAVAGADAPGRRQGHLPGPRQGRRRRARTDSTRRSTAATRSCSRTTGRWPPSTSRCSPATRAKRISAWTQATWQRLADTVDLIVDPAALVNHVLPYSQLFGPNVVGTAELIRIALTTRIKPFVYVSTIGVGDGIEPATLRRGRRHPPDQRDPQDRRQLRQRLRQQQVGRRGAAARGERPVRPAGVGVPLRHDHGRHHLRRTAQPARHVHPDDAEPGRDRALRPARSTSWTPTATGSGRTSTGCPSSSSPTRSRPSARNVVDGFETYHVMNPYDDGISMDTFVDWLIEAGYPIARVPEYAAWLARFETTLRALPEKQRQASLLPLLHNYQQPEHPINGSLAPADRFRAAVQDAKIGPDKDIPHISAPVIVKYITDLELLGLL